MAPLPRMIYQVEETREKILTQARRLFLAQGFFETQMADISLAAGISRTSLYRYYQDKTDLALDILGRVLAEVMTHAPGSTEINQRPGALEKIRLYLERMWLNPELGEAYRFLAEFDAYYGGGRIPPGFLDRLEQHVPLGEPEVLTTLVRQGIDQGHLRPDLDPRSTMITLVNAVRGFQQRLMLRGSVLVEAEGSSLEGLAAQLLDWILEGLKKKENP